MQTWGTSLSEDRVICLLELSSLNLRYFHLCGGPFLLSICVSPIKLGFTELGGVWERGNRIGYSIPL